MNAILHTQSTWRGCEFKVHQFHVKNKVQTLKTESSVDFESDSGSLGVYLQHTFKIQPWLLRESGEIMLFVNCAHIFSYFYTNSTNLRAVVGLPW